MIILAIETSCDETSIAILKNKKVLSNVTISQVLEQQKYSGVVPSLAAKLHLKNMQMILKESLLKSQIDKKNIDYISYTEKPGLTICLQIGKAIAETIAIYLEKPLIACNHLEGHIYASLLESKEKQWKFPALALVISGGHTQIYYLKNHLNFELLGETLDDAIGECLDKSAVSLGYNYPGGPIIEKLSLSGKDSYQLPLAKLDDSMNFSFSGLKTSVRRLIEKEKGKLRINDLAYSLQHNLAKTLTFKIEKILKKRIINTIILGGGVTANNYLTSYIQKFTKKMNKKINIFLPLKKYCTDNAAMIGILAYYKLQKQEIKDSVDFRFKKK